MSDDSLQTARERRQARIRERAADRLAKITNSAGRDFQTESDARQLRSRASRTQLRSPDAASTASTPASTAAIHDDPPDVLPSDLAAPSEDQFANDPLFQMLSQMQNSMGNPSGRPGGSPGPNGLPFDLNDFVAQKTGSAEGGVEESPAVKAQRRASHRLRVIVHFAIMIIVGLYSAWNPYVLLSLFVGIEAILMLALRSSAAPPSMLSPFVVYLPQPLQGPVRLLLANRMAIRQAYRDFCLVLLIYGLMHAGDGTGATARHYRVPSA